MTSPAPTTSMYRSRRPGAGRGFVRGVLHVNAALMILPGAVLFAFALIGALMMILDTAQNEQGEALYQRVAATGVSAITLLGLSVVMMMFGALIYLGLYIEDHLYELRRRPIG